MEFSYGPISIVRQDSFKSCTPSSSNLWDGLLTFWIIEKYTVEDDFQTDDGYISLPIYQEDRFVPFSDPLLDSIEYTVNKSFLAVSPKIFSNIFIGTSSLF